MPDPHWCPVCDFGPGKSLQQVRSHANSMSGFDGDHDWSELETVVREQHADQQQTSESAENDQPESAGSEPADTDDDREPPEDQPETSETTGSDQPESAGSDPYEEQWGELTGDDQMADQPESGDGGDSQTSDDDQQTSQTTSQNTGDSGGFGAAWALVAGVVVAVAYALTSANRQNPDDAATVDEDEQDEGDSEPDTDDSGPSPDPIA